MESRRRIQLILSDAKSDLFTAILRETANHAFPLWNRYFDVWEGQHGRFGPQKP